MSFRPFAFFLFLTLVGCADPEPQGDRALARSACGSCHAFPEPALLHADAWQQRVLPDMGRRLGITFVNGQPYQDVYPDHPGIQRLPLDDWHRIVRYYLRSAPRQQPVQQRRYLDRYTDLFSVEAVAAPFAYPATTFVRIDPGNRQVYAGNGLDSTLMIYGTGDRKISMQAAGGVPIDLYFNQDLQQPGPRSGLLTRIGILHPNNGRTGAVHRFTLGTDDQLHVGPALFDSLPRPVQGAATDLDGDGKQDFLVSGFGHEQGALLWMRPSGQGYSQTSLRPLPGCIRTRTRDLNGDGRLDILALFAQAEEGIFAFINQGNGRFETRPVLRFPPVYGSSYFELADMNRDGREDIIYTCGDNADLTAEVLKNYHGVYIYLNKGGFNYEQAFFYPIHGCYKAVAHDFDSDGDADLAAIAYFPDRQGQPQESFVFLQQRGNLKFEAAGIRAHALGNWLTMDAGDADGDGDIDLVLGSMLPPHLTGEGVGIEQKGPKPAFLLLRNRTR